MVKFSVVYLIEGYHDSCGSILKDKSIGVPSINAFDLFTAVNEKSLFILNKFSHRIALPFECPHEMNYSILFCFVLNRR